MISLPLYLFYSFELILVSYYDIKTRKIKNYWSVINLFFAFLGYLFFRDLFLLKWNSFLAPILFFIIGFVLYWVRVMGAGDVKFITTFFLMIPPGLHPYLIDGLIFSTIAIGALLLAINTVKHFKFVISCILIKNFRGLKILMGKKFSYAPVIFLAWIYIGYRQFFH